MKDIANLFKKNRSWANKKLKKDPNFFKNLSIKQSPKYLFIGCSDSRIPPTQILNLEPGDLFVYRNLGNIINPKELSFLATLEYATSFLNIQNIIICAHYECGTIKEAIKNQNTKILSSHLLEIKNLYIENNKLSHIKNQQDKLNELTILNLKKQIFNLSNTPIIQKIWKKEEPLNIIGLIYDMKTGKLKDLNLLLSNLDQFKKFKKNS